MYIKIFSVYIYKIFFIYKNIFYLLYILSEIPIHHIKILIKTVGYNIIKLLHQITQ